MKRCVLIMVTTFVCLTSFGQDREDVEIMFWNLENFFDYFDGGTNESDKEFSAHGARHWGKKKFLAKCNAVAKTILWVGDQKGRVPDIVAFAEVENRFVLRKLLEETPLRKYDYRIVHYDSPDPRGIDVALIYRTSSLELLESHPLRVHGTESQPLQTRDILLAEFRPRRKGEIGSNKTDGAGTMTLLVNHHPSKYGGGDTDWRRDLATARLKAVKDSLCTMGKDFIVATGDFNDTPENTVFQGDTLCPFVNLASPLATKGEGTIRYNGKWELIDMFMVTPPVEEAFHRNGSGSLEMEILHIPFLTTRDNTHSGEKPLRTYSGPRYLGGVSDHRPILLRLTLPYKPLATEPACLSPELAFPSSEPAVLFPDQFSLLFGSFFSLLRTGPTNFLREATQLSSSLQQWPTERMSKVGKEDEAKSAHLPYQHAIDQRIWPIAKEDECWVIAPPI